ncbi:MAG: response regulator [Candidatus Izemoplasmatales bacterium]|nr:response regulator [Candidatus Izemoplasmatales bacterium]
MEQRIITRILSKSMAILNLNLDVFENAFEFLHTLHDELHLQEAIYITHLPPHEKLVQTFPERTLELAEVQDILGVTEEYSTSYDAIQENYHVTYHLMKFGSFVRLSSKTKVDDRLVYDLFLVLMLMEDYLSAVYDRNRLEALEKEIREERNLMKSIFDAIPETIAYKDMNETYQMANKATNDHYSKRFPSIVGKTISDVYPEHERPVVRQLDQEVWESKGLVRRNIDMLTDKGYIRYDTIRVPIFDETKEPIGIISIGRDITEEKRMQEEIDRIAGFQQILVNLSTQFINANEKDIDATIQLALDHVGRFFHADRTYLFRYFFEKDLFEKTHEWFNESIESIGNPTRDMKLSDVDNGFVKLHLKGEPFVLRDIETLDHESGLFHLFASFDVKSVVTMPVMSQGKCYGFLGFDNIPPSFSVGNLDVNLIRVLAEIITNVIDRKERDRQLVAAKLAAENANRAKSEFLANMSHEIRTPLSGIYNSLYLFNTTALNEEQREFLEIGYNSVDNLSSIVNDILDLAKIEAGKIELLDEPMDLEDELFKIIRMQTPLATEKGIRLKFHFDYQIADLVVGDAVRLKQIVLNLVNNAIKFTEKGTVELRVRLLKRSNNHNVIQIQVTDTGIGISREDMEVITNKFFQIDSSVSKRVGGTGLGLSIVKGLIDCFHSKLDIESSVGVGSAFSFTLRLPTEKRSTEDYSWIQKQRILLVTPSREPCLMNRIFSSIGSQPVQLTKEELETHLYSNQQFDVMFLSYFYANDLETCKRLIRPHLNEHTIRAVLSEYRLSPPERAKFQFCGFDLFFEENTTKQYVISTILESRNKQPDKDLNLGNEPTFPRSSIDILLVDDNRLNRKALAMILRKNGFSIEEAEGGLEAIEKAKSHHYDLILMDVQMPDLSGIDATAQIRNFPEYVDTPIIAVTAHAFQSDYDSYLASGMDDVITKPIQFDELAKVMSVHLKTQAVHKNAPIAIPTGLLSFHEQTFQDRFATFPDLPNQLIETYFKEIESLLWRIRQAIDLHHEQDVINLAIYLKSSSEYLSGERLCFLLGLLIDDASEQKMHHADAIFHMVQNEVHTLLDHLHIFVKERILHEDLDRR